MILRRAAWRSLNSLKPTFPRSILHVKGLRRTLLTRSSLTFPQLAASPSSRYQVYLSCSHDPYYNLSLEQYLVYKASPKSTILLLYANDPCVVIGRYQNPWVEVNLHALRRSLHDGVITEHIPLLRRRSGGGTVFHDRQNLNYCVIWPTSVLDRMKHAKMVTRAIRKFNPRARVNERHDIVLDQGKQLRIPADEVSEERSGFEVDGEELAQNPPLKISGSAFRHTRGRAMHHGTCLVHSKNLKSIGEYLRSPGKAFIKAGGAESVRSQVGNMLNPDTADVSTMEALSMRVIAEFQRLYGLHEDVVTLAQNIGDDRTLWTGKECAYGRLNEICDDDVRKGAEELKSYDWIYGKTGQISLFTISSHPDDVDATKQPPLPPNWPPGLRISFTCRYGAVNKNSMWVSGYHEISETLRRLEGRAINDIASFQDELRPAYADDDPQLSAVCRWFDQVFGK